MTDAVQGASSFPNLIVTELSPQILRKASDTALATTSTGATYNLTFSARLLRSLPLMYQASLLGTEGSNVPSTYDFVNALSIAMALDPVWSVSGRIAFDHRDNGTYATNGVNYAVAVNAVPIPKIRHSLQLNGDRQDTLGEIRTNNTVGFSSTLEFYRGVYTDFSASKTVVRVSNGFTGDTTAASVGLTLVPHRTFEFRASANTARLKNSGGAVVVPVVTDAYTTELTSTWTPFPSLRLFASRRWTRSIGQAEASFRDYAADWTPFPYGSLHLAVSYTDGYRSDLAATTRTFAPLLRWDITRRAYLSLSYQDLNYQSVVQTTVSRTWFATLRIGF